ncbi:Metal Transporter Cnnm3 [Manis pentadactyla]|nr:Metal Transporter Cnnm3 [Manis pentadactyla]
MLNSNRLYPKAPEPLGCGDVRLNISFNGLHFQNGFFFYHFINTLSQTNSTKNSNVVFFSNIRINYWRLILTYTT